VSKQPALLQDRNDLIDEIIECAGKPRRHDIESIGRTGDKPLLESCRDLFRRTAQQAVSHGAGGNIAQLTQRQVLALRQRRQGRGMAAKRDRASVSVLPMTGLTPGMTLT
jgi:hypothetical protein